MDKGEGELGQYYLVAMNAVEASGQMWVYRIELYRKCIVVVMVTLAMLHPIPKKESMVQLKVDDLWMCS